MKPRLGSFGTPHPIAWTVDRIEQQNSPKALPVLYRGTPLVYSAVLTLASM